MASTLAATTSSSSAAPAPARSQSTSEIISNLFSQMDDEEKRAFLREQGQCWGPGDADRGNASGSECNSSSSSCSSSLSEQAEAFVWASRLRVEKASMEDEDNDPSIYDHVQLLTEKIARLEKEAALKKASKSDSFPEYWRRNFFSAWLRGVEATEEPNPQWLFVLSEEEMKNIQKAYPKLDDYDISMLQHEDSVFSSFSKEQRNGQALEGRYVQIDHYPADPCPMGKGNRRGNLVSAGGLLFRCKCNDGGPYLTYEGYPHVGKDAPVGSGTWQSLVTTIDECLAQQKGIYDAGLRQIRASKATRGKPQYGGLSGYAGHQKKSKRL